MEASNKSTDYIHKSELLLLLNIIALFGICLTLLMAFYYQLFLNEIPCPLCQLQRVGLTMVGFGFALNCRFGVKPSHYGLIILSAILGASISLRQILLHIQPGDPGFGSAIFGIHMYSWGFVAFVVTIIFSALMLFWRNKYVNFQQDIRSKQMVTFAHLAILLLLILSVGNLLTDVLACGFAPCPGDPDGYILLQ